MNRNVMVSCLVTGAGDPVGKHPAIPVTPEQIADTDVALNITAGRGGDWIPGTEDSAIGGPCTSLRRPAERHRPVGELLPEICTLACGSYNFADNVYVSIVAGSRYPDNAFRRTDLARGDGQKRDRRQDRRGYGLRDQADQCEPPFILNSLKTDDLDIYLGGWMPTEKPMIDPLVESGDVKVLKNQPESARFLRQYVVATQDQSARVLEYSKKTPAG